MKCLFLILLPFFFSPKCTEIDFKAPYLFSSEIQELIDSSSGANSSENYAATMEYINIGQYERHQKLSNMLYPQRLKAKDSSYNTIALNEYEERDAIEEIVKSARDKRVVILNEDHFSPYNRVFARRLIIELAKIGFTGLAVEMYHDSTINIRGYPLLDKSYASEPQFANLLREASKLKFDIFNYEINGEEFLSFINKNGVTKAEGYRDRIAAQNLTNYLETNPNERLIIYCGHQHVYEYDLNDKYHPMAKFLKEYSGIDPLTIDQAEWHPYSSSTSNRAKNKGKASVYYNKQKEYYGIIRGQKRVDITLFSPNNTLIHNRQQWLFDDSYKPRKIKIPEHLTNEEVMVFAYRKNEPMDKGVPVDCQEATDKGKEVWLSLPAGEYQLVYHTKSHSCITYKTYK